ncbi:MAG: 30S ribosomal protein S9 [Phycisphaerales bacterium]|jgi:small subunit ribosomal protein S9|nr:30S ribosomal protein S9 [Phycisphaerales bacterium]
MTEDTPNTDPTQTDAAPADTPTPEAIAPLPSELLTPEVEESAPAATPSAGGWFWGTGRRKASVARVRVRGGSGEFKVNGRDMTEFFTEERDHKSIGAVLEATNTTGGVQVHVNVHGGGYTGQAGAIILGLGRALMQYDGALEPVLRDRGFLSRDPRRVERKKPGQPGARKRFQFSKR